MKSQKQKAKSKRPRTKLTKQGQKALVAALKHYENKHPVYVALETLEGQARRLLEADGFPVDMDTLAQYHHAPLGQRADKKAEEQWRQNFEKYHLRFFPEDRGKILTRRGALLKQILWQAERVREGIASGDPEAAGLHGIRLMQWASRAGVSLVTSKAGRVSKDPHGILHAIAEEIEAHGPVGPKRLWKHFTDPDVDGPLIDEDDFQGDVFFDEGEDKLIQAPSRGSKKGRQRGITYKTFEAHYYKILRPKHILR